MIKVMLLVQFERHQKFKILLSSIHNKKAISMAP